MKRAKINPIFFIWLGFIACHQKLPKSNIQTTIQDTLKIEGERHLNNIRQLTFGGNNAEAYWSFDSKKLSFQSDNSAWGNSCDQIYYFDIRKDDLRKGPAHLISKNQGRNTCSYFMPGDKHIIFASTCGLAKSCPAVPERKPGGKYVWPVYDSYEIYISDLDGKIIKQLTKNNYYDAEATVSPNKDKIVYTSTKSGDLELYVCDLDGKNEVQVTHDLGYDGGAFFSPDGKKLVFRASRPETELEIKEYKELLAQGLVQPTNMELYTCNIDGSNLKQITKLGKANWAPFYHPSGRRIIFSSNHKSTRGFEFNLYMINEDGSDLEQITFDKVFASFPMFSPDGKKLAFSSNRNNGGTHDTNLFVAEWVD